MVTDKERRDVARRLRGLDDSELQVYDMTYFAIQRAVGGGGDQYPDGRELTDRLADLIEPSEPEVRCVAEVKVDGERLEKLAHDAAAELTGIDRDALLEEVKELEKCAYYFGLDFDEDEPLRDRLKEASEAFAESSRRIREALGVGR